MIGFFNTCMANTQSV